MQSFGVQCTNTSTSLCICLCASVRFSVSFVRFDSFYRWHNLYAHTGCVCALCMHYDRHSKNGWDDGVVYALCRSFLTLKYPASLLAYRNPKSHFMHRRFESKCSIFPLSRFTSYTRSVVPSVYFDQPLYKNPNKFFGC